jgi:hypothetical protein
VDQHAEGGIAVHVPYAGERYRVRRGDDGRKWSALPENAGLPDHIKRIIDGPYFQETCGRQELIEIGWNPYRQTFVWGVQLGSAAAASN